MIDQDKMEFSAMLTGISELYGKTLSDAVIRLYWEALKEFTVEEVRSGFTRHTQDPNSGQFFPKPADVVRQVGGTVEDAALIAWNVVHHANVGQYDSVVFPDTIIHAVITDMGGWVYFCERRAHDTDKDWSFFMREWLDRYKAYRRAGRYSGPDRLIGLHESNNAKEFPEHVPPTKFIEDARNDIKKIGTKKEERSL